MSKYPKINYIGNKNKLTDWIVDNFPYNKGTVLDLFCGGCSVSYALKEKGYKVYSNDALYSNYVLAKAIIENNNVTLDKIDFEFNIPKKEISKKYKEIIFLENRLYFPNEVEELAELVCKSNQLKDYKKYLFLSLIRRSMIRKIPYSRMNVPWNQIVKLRDEDYSYAKYKRRRAYHNLPFIDHIYDNLDNYNNSVFDNNQNNMAFNYDAFKMIDNLSEKVDVIYMDPPYPATMNKYGDFYGLYDNIFDKEIKYTNFSENNRFLENLEKLIIKCLPKTKYIVISENNKTKPTISEISTMISKYGKVEIKEKKHQYKVTNKENKNETIEVLIILEVKKNK